MWDVSNKTFRCKRSSVSCFPFIRKCYSCCVERVQVLGVGLRASVWGSSGAKRELGFCWMTNRGVLSFASENWLWEGGLSAADKGHI